MINKVSNISFKSSQKGQSNIIKNNLSSVSMKGLNKDTFISFRANTDNLTEIVKQNLPADKYELNAADSKEGTVCIVPKNPETKKFIDHIHVKSENGQYELAIFIPPKAGAAEKKETKEPTPDQFLWGTADNIGAELAANLEAIESKYVPKAETPKKTLLSSVSDTIKFVVDNVTKFLTAIKNMIESLLKKDDVKKK